MKKQNNQLLIDILKNFDLDARTENIIRRSKEIYDIESFLEYYELNGHFKRIRNCGEKSNKQLIDLVKHLKKNHSFDKINNLELEEEGEEHLEKTLPYIARNYDLSVRTQNILLNSDEFHDIRSFLNYFNRKGGFLDIEGCGSVSDNELINLAVDFKQNVSRNSLYKSDLIKPQNFNNVQKNIFRRVIKTLVKNSNGRAKRLIKDVTNEDYTVNNVKKSLFSSNTEELLRKENIGSRTLSQFNEVRTFIKNVIELLPSLDEESDAELKLAEYFVTKFSKIDEFTFKRLTDNDSAFPLFKVCEIHIQNGAYSSNEKLIFSQYLRYFRNEPEYTLEEMGEKLDLTRERVRQIRNKIIKSFDSKFAFVPILSQLIGIERNYGLDDKVDFIVFDSQKAEQINRKENVHFTNIFIARILSLTESEKNILGYELNYHTKQKSKKFPPLENVYLVNNSICERFDFKKFLSSINKIIDNGIYETYEVGLKSYISKYIKNFDLEKDINLLRKLDRICTELIINETELTVSPSGKIIFIRNKKRKQKQIIELALKELGYNKEGYHISDIAKKINEIAPNRNLHSKIDSIRSNLNRNKTTFVHIGRSSTYGLKIWQDEYSEFKGGTIREIVEQFLNKLDEPKHISEIAKHVNKFRNTNESNIHGNLLLDNSNTFHIYPHHFIGLQKKSYDSSKLDFNEVKGGLFTYQALKKYFPDYYDEVIEKISRHQNLKKIQVKPIIDNKIQNGSIIVNSNNILTLRKTDE